MRNEYEITEKLRALSRFSPGSPVVLGIGDDCAIYRPRGSADDLLFTSDLCIEGIHFTRESHKLADVAYLAVARSLSDIAAMGGSPRFSLASVSVGQSDASVFFDELAKAATGFGAPLAGGDLARSDRIFCEITACGALPRGTAIRRDGARAGDGIYVSGQLGGSARGLHTRKGKAWRRHVHPEPRLELGEFLREKLRATSCIDVSDGLSLDLWRICMASRAAAEISDPPRFPGATAEEALEGGEDYELLFTVRPATRVPAKFNGLPLTRIGTIVEGTPGEIRLHGQALEPLGFDHFDSDHFARR